MARKKQPDSNDNDLPEVPREWLMQLLDTLRHFSPSKDCDGSCVKDDEH